MQSIILTVAAVLLPVPVIYLFYLRYFRIKPRFLDHLEYFVYGILLAAVVILIQYFMFQDVSDINPFLRGFYPAAFTEKTGAFVFIFILIYRVRSKFSVPDAIILSMLVGLGFASLENLVYSITIHKSVIIVRSISSVHLHMLTCGLMGYYTALIRFNDWTFNRLSLLLKALLIPFLFHGTFDTLLFMGGSQTYIVAFILIVLVAVMEYIFEKSQSLPVLDDLKAEKLSLEDWHTIQQEPQYERWILRSMGSKIWEFVPFFQLSLGTLKTIVILILAAAAVTFYFARDLVHASLQAGLKMDEVIMLFTLIPALYGLNLLLVGIVNPQYFRNSIIRIPIIIDVVVSLDIDPTQDDVIDTVTYHITGMNTYLKTPESLSPGEKVKCILYCSRFSSPILEGEIVWDSHDEQEQHKGSLMRFTSLPAGFWLFLFRYYLYRILRGITFNLRFPGSREIRQLFVRPVSVMQNDKSFKAGHLIFSQGDSGSNFYLIRKGEVNIMKKLGTGKQVLLNTLSRGDIFGEMAIIGNQPRMASAVCKTDCILAEAQADNLGALIESNPDFTQQLIKTLANRFQSSDNIMYRKIARIKSNMERTNELLYSILKLLLICSGNECRGKDIEINVNTDLMRNILGDDFEVVNRLIKLLSQGLDINTLEEQFGIKRCKSIINALKDYNITAGEE